MLGYALIGLGLAPLLGGGWSDTFYATLFSMLVYGLVLLSGRLGAAATEWLPLTSAFVVGLLATVVRLWVPELNLVLVILSAVAMLLPGYTISLGAGELVAQHVVSGMANLMSGLVCLVKQTAGAWLGIVTASFFVSGAAAEPAAPVDSLWVQLLFPLLLVGLCLAFQTSRRDLPWAVLVSGVAYLGIMAGTSILDANLGNLVGTIIAVAEIAGHPQDLRPRGPGQELEVERALPEPLEEADRLGDVDVVGAGPGLYVGGGIAPFYGFRKYRTPPPPGCRYATKREAFRFNYVGSFRRKNSPFLTEVRALASGIDRLNFFGFGNETPDIADRDIYKVKPGSGSS